MKEEKDVIKKETPVPFDGFIDVVAPEIDGSYKTYREKLYLSDSEAKDFMGDNDLNKYWRTGRVFHLYKGEFGSLLPDTALEKETCDKVFAKFPGILIFRHPFQSLYTLLIPKEYSSLEKDKTGEYANRLIHCDARSIVFGAGDGGAFTAKSFTNKAKKILTNIVKTNADDFLNDI